MRSVAEFAFQAVPRILACRRSPSSATAAGLWAFDGKARAILWDLRIDPVVAASEHAARPSAHHGVTGEDA